jgi:general secretion pathway protein G
LSRDVSFPIFLRSRDDTHVSRFDSLEGLRRSLEAIDVENEEFEAWDDRGFRVRLLLLDSREIGAESSGDRPAIQEALRAFTEFASAEAVTPTLPPMGESLLPIYEVVQAAIRAARKSRPWYRRLPGVVAGCVVLVAIGAVLLVRVRTPIDAGPEFPKMRTRVVVAMVGDALSLFYSDIGRYPTLEEGLEVLGAETEGKGPYLRAMRSIPDGWRQPLIYRPAGQGERAPFALYSIGPNGMDEGGQGDDISFWSDEVQRQLPRP